MRFISTRAHGMLDYAVGIFLIAAPWIFDFARGEAETWIPVILGAGTILYSLLTDYELGASRKISMKSHLWLDGLAGAFLAASPWLFDFVDYVYLPHLIVGIAEIGAALMTKTVSSTEHHHTGDILHRDHDLRREDGKDRGVRREDKVYKEHDVHR